MRVVSENKFNTSSFTDRRNFSAAKTSGRKFTFTAQTNLSNTGNYPTLRSAATPKSTRWSLGDEGITNRRDDYGRAIQFKKTAVTARKNIESKNSVQLAGGNISSAIYDGNAAKKTSFVPFLKPNPKERVKPKDTKMHAVRGQAHSVLNTSSISPNLVSLSKLVASVVVVFAIMAFVRIGLTTATVSNSIDSKEISTQIDNELVNKNNLEVQTSALSNSSRIKSAAANYNLVNSQANITVNLPQDVLVYDGNDVSLVESLNRLASTNQ